MKAVRISIVVIITLIVIFFVIRFTDRSLDDYTSYKNVSDNISYSDFIDRYGKPYKEVKNSINTLDTIFYDLYKTDNYEVDENANRICLFYEAHGKYVFGYEFDSATNKLLYKACIRLDLTAKDFEKLSLGDSRNKVLNIVKDCHRVLGSGFAIDGYKLADGSWYALEYQQDKLVRIRDDFQLSGTD